MSATTLAAPIRVDTVDDHARPGLGRLVTVELRKMVNTRAGFWLQIAMVALTAVVVIARRVFGDGADHTFAGVLDVGLQPAAVLLPITGILLITSEWSQRTGMITFTLVPVRSRVLGAKLLASLVLALAALVTAVAVVAAGVLVASPSVEGTWSAAAALIGQSAVFLTTGMVVGVALWVRGVGGQAGARRRPPRLAPRQPGALRAADHVNGGVLVVRLRRNGP